MDIVIKDSHIHGRGVMARTLIPVGEWQYVYGWLKEYVPGDITDRYGFEWDNDHKIFIPFAPWCFVNHNTNPNCEVEVDHETGVVTIEAIRAVPRGYELTIDYGFDPTDHYA